MTQRNLTLGVEDTYAELKSALNKRGYRVVVDESNKRLVVEQGSLWGISPRAAKKRIRFDLAPADSGTQISASSKISSDWTKTAEIGCVLAVLMASVCFWIGLDLRVFVATQQSTFWSWLFIVNGYNSIFLAESFANLALFLALFLLVAIVLEGLVVGYAHRKVGEFAEESLNSLI